MKRRAFLGPGGSRDRGPHQRVLEPRRLGLGEDPGTDEILEDRVAGPWIQAGERRDMRALGTVAQDRHRLGHGRRGRMHPGDAAKDRRAQSPRDHRWHHGGGRRGRLDAARLQLTCELVEQQRVAVCARVHAAQN